MRKKITAIHAALAAFFLPAGLMYAITGGLYTWNITGKYNSSEELLSLSQPLTGELSQLAAIAEAELAKRGMAAPSGEARLRKGGTSYYFEWTGARHDIQIHPTTDPLQAKIKLQEAGPHRFFVQLHKAKGGDLFKVFAAVWAVALVALFISGGVLAFLIAPYRRVATISATLGLLTFAAAAGLS